MNPHEFPTWKDLQKQLHKDDQPQEQTGPEWPAPIEYLNFRDALLEKPRPLFENLLDAASRMIFGGGSKTYKTWAMSDMALSIATGVPWWGFPAFSAPALYVNFELKEYYFQRRLRAIEAAKKIELKAGQLTIWNLRGFEITLEAFKTELLQLIAERGIVVVFVDPFYKLLMGRDERLSAEINLIMAAFDELNRLSGASIVFAAHFTKGNQAGKEAIDRISGGGSINRDPDNLVTLTKHETEHAFTVDFTLRDFAPVAPFVVRWDYPLLLRAEDLDPEKIKRPQPRGRPKYDPDALFNLIRAFDDELSTEELIAKADEELQWSRRTVFNKLEVLKRAKRIFFSMTTNKWNVSPQ